jgi:hypothetical protein
MSSKKWSIWSYGLFKYGLFLINVCLQIVSITIQVENKDRISHCVRLILLHYGPETETMEQSVRSTEQHIPLICAIRNIDFIEFSIIIGYGPEHTSKLGIEGKHLLLNQYTQGSRLRALWGTTRGLSCWFWICLLGASVVYVTAVFALKHEVRCSTRKEKNTNISDKRKY